MKHTIKTVQAGSIETYTEKTIIANENTTINLDELVNSIGNLDLHLILKPGSGKTITINVPNIALIPHGTYIKMTNAGSGSVVLGENTLSAGNSVILQRLFDALETIIS